MFFRQQYGLLAGGNVGINLCRGNGAVPQKGLDISNIHPGLQQLRGKGVTEHMGRYVIGNIDPFT